MVLQRRIFGFRLHEVHRMGDVVEDEPKRWNSQLIVVPGFIHCDLRLDVVSPNQPRFGGVLSQKLSPIGIVPDEHA